MLIADKNTTQTDKQTVSCYLRHNQAPIQIINANPTANNKTIAPLQSEVGTGTGFYANNSMANNMGFSTGGDYGVDFYNFANNYSAACFAIIAPKGYRFTEYWMSICSNKYPYSILQRDNGSKGATIMRYTYNEGTTYQFTPCEGESLTLSSQGADEEIFSHTLSNAGNILYFKIDYTSTAEFATHLNQLRLTYVIDGDVEATLPNTESEAGTQVHTGYINLGALTQHTAYPEYYFNKANVTDLEDVNIVAENGTTEMSIENGTINVPAGTYWIESPAKFRITGAKLNFQLAAGHTETTWEPTTTLTSGKNYKIGDGNGNYITLNNNRNVTRTTDINSATAWNVTSSGSGYVFSTVIGTTTYYLYAGNTGGTISANTSQRVWSYNSDNHYLTYQGSSNQYGIRYNSGQWAASNTSNRTPTSLTFYKETITGEDYEATLYGANGTDVAGTTSISTSSTTGSVEATGLNNDGVKFTVAGGHAGFTVDLTMQPLDPNLQNLEFDYLKNGAESGNRVSAAATNFQFNAGETIVIPLEPGVSNPQVVFRNAFNESRVAWYDGTATGLSNYYLVDSEYETTGTETGLQKPSGKVDANRAGTTKIEFSNIKTLTANGGTLTETEFNKNNAGYSNITLATTPKTVYIYSADKPEYCIMPAANKKNTHVAYTFYDATLQGSPIEEEPVITVTPLFSSSLKRNNQKVAVYNAQVSGANASVADDSATDTEHQFYGVTVTAQKKDGASGTVYGYLSSEDIESAIETAMAGQSGIYDGDVMRTILYVDMSSLKSISGNESSWKKMMLGTADNCLFFMPTSFSIAQEMQFGGIVAGGEAGRAVTDIVVIDQQPFFSPHSFYTSTHVARYERTQTNDKPTVTKSTLVLPFSIMLNSNGNPKPTTDSEDTKVTFYNLNSMTLYADHRAEDGTYLDGVAGKITASPVTTGTAVANTPYYVTSTENDAKTSFKIQVQGATFAKTTLGEMTATSDDSDMTAHGSYNGQEKAKEDKVLYWSKDYFWYSVSDYLKTATVKFLPFRAYYTTSAPLTAKEGKFMLMFNETGETDGIEDSLSRQQTAQSVYDLQGRKLSVGSDQLSTLSKGIYIVNGKKIFVK